MGDKRISDLNALQDKLYRRLQDVEDRIRVLEGGGASVIGSGAAPLLYDKKTRIDQAAWTLEDAIYDRALPKEDEATKWPEDIIRARLDHVDLLNANKRYNWAIIALILLTFLEVPPWCHSLHGGAMKNWQFQSGAEWCPLPAPPAGNSNPNLSGVSYLPPGYAFIVEVIIESVILYKFWRGYTLERDHFWPMGVSISKPFSNLGFLLAIGSIIDTAVFMVFHNAFRMTFIFRSGLIFLLPKVQHIFFNIFNKTVMTEFGSVAVFFLGTMIFFAWVGMTIFKEATIFSFMDGEEKVLANKGFTSFPDAFNTMFVGGVTGEFIDCYLPSFNSYRLSGVIWMIYLLLTQVLFKNLVMDTLISAYLKGKEEEDDIVIGAQIDGMLVAFNLLSDCGTVITKDDFIQLIKVLRKSPRWKPIPLEAAEMMYDKFETINKKNFVNVCSLLQSDFWITERESWYLSTDDDGTVLHGMMSVEEADWVRGCVWEDPELDGEPAKFDKIMNNVLLLNLVMVVVESTYDLMEIAEPEILDIIEVIFSFVYVGEVTTKLLVKSWGEYRASAANLFDFATTWLLLCTSVLKYLPFASIKGDLSRYANILRLLRLIRILKQLKRFPQVQFMILVISRIVFCAGEVLMLMGTFFFFFCCLAVNLFGGLLHEGNESLEGSEYAEKHWYILNFNDMFMAFMSWFVQILCEYVPNYSDALNRAATAKGLSYGPYSGMIVFFFYITTAAIMYELLLAFTVDVFMAVKEEVDPEEDEEVEEEKEEEEEEKEDAEEKEAEKKEGAEGGEESSDSEFDAEEFLNLMQDKVFTETEEVIHYRIKCEAAFQDELKEKYEQIIKGKGTEIEGARSLQVTKAAWLFENGVWNQQIECASKNAELAALKKEKEEAEEDPAKQAELKEQIDALLFRADLDYFPVDVEAAREAHIGVLEATKGFYKAIVCLVILTLTEVPAWCHAAKASHLGAFSWAAGSEWCRAPAADADLKLSGIWYVPPAYSLVVEFFVEAVILRRFILEYYMEKEHFSYLGTERGDIRYSNLANVYVGCVCAIGSILDTGIFAMFKDPFRMTFLFRTGLLCLLPGVQRLSVRIFNRQMLGQFASVAVFFIGTVLFFAWIAVTVYKESTQISFVMKGEPISVNKGFEGLQSAIYTMFLAGMTEGFDDIFIPTVTNCRASAILWLAFLLLTQVLFLNLVIDAFVAAYLEGSENHTKVTAHTQAVAIFKASTLLFGEEAMEKEVFMKFIAEINRSPRMRPMPENVGNAMFDQFIEEFGAINKESFCDVCSLVQNSIWVTPKNSPLEKMAPGVWNSDWFQSIRNTVWPQEKDQNPWFDEFMDTILLLNLVFMITGSIPGGADYIPEWLHLTTFFTLIYVWEVGVKLSIKAWSTYWSEPANQFDFYTTWILFATWALKFVKVKAVQQDLMHYANLLRLLRLLRVVKKLKKYPRVQFMVTTIVRMVEAAGDILALLGVVLFFFATFSVNFFGGLLYEGNPKLEGSDYKEKNWYVFNFNDVMMGYVTWFTQLLSEYNPEWADGLYRVSSIGAIAWYIYPTFYIFGVAIVFEILKAFTIETYLALKEEADGDEEESESSDSEDPFEFENEVIEALQDQLKEDNKSLHFKMSILPALQKQIKSAYAEALEEEENEAKKEKEPAAAAEE